jgi:hypothetical protein
VRGEQSPIDAAAVLLALGLALTATLVGVRTGWHPADADEIVFRDTLIFMRQGTGFYQAQREALIVKERRPPTSVRAIRPPTVYLVLRWFPPGSWRWLVGLVYLADLLLAWRLARAHGPPAGLMGVALAGIWILGFSSYLFLHAEVWGLPLFLGGLLALRAERAWTAAGLFVAATCVRELYAVGLLGGLVLAVTGIVASHGPWRPLRTRLRPWLVAVAGVCVLYAIHTALAMRVLSAHGYNARLGNEQRTMAFLLRLAAPISSGPGELFGIAVAVLGVVGGLRVARRDPAAAVAVGGGVALFAASVWATRVYWSACWAVPLAAFAPVALGLTAAGDRDAALSTTASTA